MIGTIGSRNWVLRASKAIGARVLVNPVVLRTSRQVRDGGGQALNIHVREWDVCESIRCAGSQFGTVQSGEPLDEFFLIF
jgi:hypothetical protein